VIRDGLRPDIPDSIKDDKLVKLMQECWDTDPDQRPSFSEINSRLDDMLVTPDSASEPKPMRLPSS